MMADLDPCQTERPAPVKIAIIISPELQRGRLQLKRLRLVMKGICTNGKERPHGGSRAYS
jgi:hypothetical protein